MRRLLMLATLTILVARGYCQFDTTRLSQSEALMLKSKKQKSGANTLLIASPILIGAGLLLGNRKESTFGEAGAGVILGGVGVLSAIGSIPLFIAAGRNRNKSEALVSMKVERINISWVRGLSAISQPGIKLTFRL